MHKKEISGAASAAKASGQILSFWINFTALKQFDSLTLSLKALGKTGRNWLRTQHCQMFFLKKEKENVSAMELRDKQLKILS